MNTRLRTAALAACAAFATACATLPETASLPITPDLDETYHSSTVVLRQRSGFDPADFDAARIDRIHIAVPDTASDAERAAYAALRKAFADAVSGDSAQPARPTVRTARIELVVKDVRFVDPALNVLSAIALLVPLDKGAMTVEASFQDSQGTVVAQRFERVGGSALDIANALSRSGRLEQAARDWVATCSAWPACAVPPQDSR